jgi:hypothetical protein
MLVVERNLMFLVLPASENFSHDAVRWFTDLEYAYDCAIQWSSELQGQMVNLYEFYNGKVSIVTQVTT